MGVHPKEKKVQGVYQDKMLTKASPILSRGFFITEWTKPKFDIAKPYTTSRDNTASATQNELYEEEKPHIKKAEELVSKIASSEFPKPCTNVQIPNCCHNMNKRVPGNVSPMNLERLLIFPIVPLAHVSVRNYTRKDKQDLFWRPKARIPDENEIVKRLRNPVTRNEAEKEVKYLFLNYGNAMEKKNSNQNQNERNNVTPPKKSAISES